MSKYDEIFIRIFGLNKEQLNDNLLYQSVEAWDSIGHMEMIAEIEEAYDIMMEAEDIIDFNSYAKGKELLQKYGVKSELI